jgi:hypothetical protein
MEFARGTIKATADAMYEMTMASTELILLWPHVAQNDLLSMFLIG